MIIVAKSVGESNASLTRGMGRVFWQAGRVWRGGGWVPGPGVGGGWVPGPGVGGEMIEESVQSIMSHSHAV